MASVDQVEADGLGAVPTTAEPRTSWYLAIIITLASVLSYVDRQILNLLLEPIKHAFSINDTQASLLVGAAFAILFVLVGLPLGWLADRYNRRNIIAGSIAAWTVMTASCGLAGTYGQLFLARVGVGLGEAGLGPAAVSMISDRYGPLQRGRAFAFYAAAIPVGSGLAMLGGGALMSVAPQIAHFLKPALGLLKPWQVIFVAVCLPGLILAPLAMTLREPPRPRMAETTDSVMGALPFLWRRRSVYVPFVGGLAVLPIMGFGFSAWLPALLIRVHHWSIAQVGVGYGCLLLTCGPLGTFLGGALADRLAAGGRRDAHLILLLLILPALGINNAIAANLPVGWAVLTLYAPGIILGAAPAAIGHAALALITPPPLRARMYSIYLLSQSILGLSLGPTLIAVLTDYVFVNPLQLGRAMGVVAISAGFAGWLLMFLARRPYKTLVNDPLH